MKDVEALLQAHRFPEAARLLVASASRSDPDALYVLALWRVSGAIIRRDLSAARALMAQAASLDHPDAIKLSATFEANGLGGLADWPKALALLAKSREPEAPAQIALLDAMDLTPTGDPKRLSPGELISERPHARTARCFLTSEECSYLRNAASPLFQPSLVIDPTSGRQVAHPIRLSDAALFGVTQEDPVVAAINRRIAAFSSTTPTQGEPLQILRYRPGGEYKAHMDALAGEPNQRILTVLIYLTDDYQGGETRFLRTGLSFRGRAGDALLFCNVDADGQPDPLSQHAGAPVTKGEKLIASRWIRAKPLAFPPPQPLTDL